MDYPAPDVRVVGGKLDFSSAYGVGIGPWDKFSAKMIYGDMSEDETEAAYTKAVEDGLVYVADRDGRGIGGGHPQGAIWDNGEDPIAALNETLEVRRIALANFGADRIREGQPMSDLNRVIVPIYLYHRYQTAAAGKLLGGMRFSYARRGDQSPGVKIVPAGRQKDALSAILKTIEPGQLDLSNATLKLFTPSLTSWTFLDSDRELFRRTAHPAFDLVSAADTAADLTFDVLLNPQRAARMIEFKRRDARSLGFSEMLEVTKRKVLSARPTGRQAELSNAVQRRFVYGLMELIENDNATPAVKAAAQKSLSELMTDFSRRSGDNADFVKSEIQRFLERPVPSSDAISKEERLPPGSPIGTTLSQLETCWFCD